METIDEKGTYSLDELKDQCTRYFDFFGLKKEDVTDKSYSNLILEKNNKKPR